MNRKLLTFLLIACLLVSSCWSGKKEYSNNMISYLKDKGRNSYIISYDLDTGKEVGLKVGNKEDIFWACLDISEEGNTVVLNNDEIYSINGVSITKHPDIAKRIVAVKRIGERYLLVSQFEGEFIIKIFDGNFGMELFEKKVDGLYGGMCKEPNRIYVTSYNTSSDKSYLHELDLSEDYRYSRSDLLDYAASVVPVRLNGETYIFINNRIYETIGSDPIYKLYKKGTVDPVYEFEGFLNYYTIYDDAKIIFLNGLNSSKINMFDFSTGKNKQIEFPDNETARGIYNLHGRIVIVSDKGIYEFLGNGLEKIHSMESSLVNHFN